MFATNQSDFNWKFIYVILYIYIYDYKIIYEIPLQSIEPVEFVKGLAIAFALLAALLADLNDRRPVGFTLETRATLLRRRRQNGAGCSATMCYLDPYVSEACWLPKLVVVPCGTFSPFLDSD